jgi:hypothetical protein
VYASEFDGLTGFYNGSNVIDVTGPIEVTQGDLVEYKVVMRVGLSHMSSFATYALYGCI